MIIIHIAGNIVFILFLVIVILEFAEKKRNMEIVTVGSLVLGCALYIAYIIMLIIDFNKSGFDTQSFSMLILAWAFENVAYCTSKK